MRTRAEVTVDKYGATISLPSRQWKLLKKYLNIRSENENSFSVFENETEIMFVRIPTKKEKKAAIKA